MLDVERMDEHTVMLVLRSNRVDYEENEALFHAVRSILGNNQMQVTGIIMDLSAAEEVVSYNYLMRMEQDFSLENCRLVLVIVPGSQPDELHAHLGLSRIVPAVSSRQEALSLLQKQG